ncbi:SPOR domain-containing protein [Salegentibacter sp. F188]|uniref:SPOR domain-containing protein n=1 Tax=Autumnicola patrickiae TaxID=3075591 RepID=A0ABU3E001_9FLAO|nr:SPOR domain-containing protein [Salegentibacter sp. F188]MDT0689280.1 SPOR domain-containing protein [Salegentibacter sp. F188]
MRILNLKNLIFSGFLTAISFTNISAQDAWINISQDQKIPKLLELKIEMSEANKIGDRYKIQLFYGDNNEASEVFKDYESKHSYPAMIDYETPNYKVYVGNFRNRLEADRALLEIKENFPGAFIPKPKRR